MQDKADSLEKNVDDRFMKMMMFVNNTEKKTDHNFDMMQETFEEIVKKTFLKKKTDKLKVLNNIK